VEGLRRRIEAIAKTAGLDRVGFTGTEAFPEVALSMHRRIESGMSAGLGFTYRDPSTATTPRLSFPWGRTLVVGARAYLPESGSPDLDLQSNRPTGKVSRVTAGDGYEPVRAGLGWWGKNTMVLIGGIGPWAVIGSVITDAEVEPDQPVDRDCGACSACLPACPTGALATPGVLDAERCLAAWAQRPGLMPPEYRIAMGDRLYGCDDCLVACPPGGRLLRRAGEPGGRFDLRAILHASDRSLLAWFGHWFIPDRDPGIVRRNALIAAGNSASEQIVPQVALYAGHPDWVLRAHAAWALVRIGGDGAGAVLDQRRTFESDVRVRAELP
jgi:epoxyqueuosine reductase